MSREKLEKKIIILEQKLSDLKKESEHLNEEKKEIKNNLDDHQQSMESAFILNNDNVQPRQQGWIEIDTMLLAIIKDRIATVEKERFAIYTELNQMQDELQDNKLLDPDMETLFSTASSANLISEQNNTEVTNPQTIDDRVDRLNGEIGSVLTDVAKLQTELAKLNAQRSQSRGKKSNDEQKTIQNYKNNIAILMIQLKNLNDEKTQAQEEQAAAAVKNKDKTSPQLEIWKKLNTHSSQLQQAQAKQEKEQEKGFRQKVEERPAAELNVNVSREKIEDGLKTLLLDTQMKIEAMVQNSNTSSGLLAARWKAYENIFFQLNKVRGEATKEIQEMINQNHVDLISPAAELKEHNVHSLRVAAEEARDNISKLVLLSNENDARGSI